MPKTTNNQTETMIKQQNKVGELSKNHAQNQKDKIVNSMNDSSTKLKAMQNKNNFS